MSKIEIYYFLSGEFKLKLFAKLGVNSDSKLKASIKVRGLTSAKFVAVVLM